jgi:hypothetical protein
MKIRAIAWDHSSVRVDRLRSLRELFLSPSSSAEHFEAGSLPVTFPSCGL